MGELRRKPMKIEEKKYMAHFHSEKEKVNKIYQITTLYFIYIVPIQWKTTYSSLTDNYKIRVA